MAVVMPSPAKDLSAANWSAWRWRAARFITPALLIIGWETLVRGGTISSYMLPPLSAVLQQIGEHITSGELLVNLATTLFRTFSGFIIAAIGVLGFGWIVAQYAKRIHAAGSLYDYVTDGLGTKVGAAAGLRGVCQGRTGLGAPAECRRRRGHAACCQDSSCS